MLRSRAWSGDKVTFGVQGQVRAVEITYGDAGWHPHLHLCVVTDVPLSQEMAEEMGGRMFDVYARGLGKRGLSAVAERGGLHVEVVNPGDGDAVARYMSKLGLELVSPHMKTARKRGT